MEILHKNGAHGTMREIETQLKTDAPSNAYRRTTGAHNVLVSPAILAEQWGLKLQPNGKWSGPHPTDKNIAAKNGFILFPEGNARTNSGEKYTSRQVAEMAGLTPDLYEPYAKWKQEHGHPVTSNPRVKVTSSRTQPAPVIPTSAPPSLGAKGVSFNWSEAEKFDYYNETGNELLIQVGRIGSGPNKEIRQRRPDGQGGWVYSIGDARRVLWNLRDVLAAEIVFICEGEKAAGELNARLKDTGLYGRIVATCNIGGAGKWREEYNEALGGKAVGVLPDNDTVGKEHGAAVLCSIHSAGVAVSLKCLDLPNLPPKGDACEFFEDGGTVAHLLQLLDATPQWKPEKVAPLFPRIRLDEVFSRPHLEDLVEGVLRVRTTSVFGSEYGGYKSFILLDIGLSIATGRKWQGRRVKQGRVVYIVAEGAYETKARAQAWLQFHGVQEIPQDFEIIEIPVQIASQYQQLIEELRELSPEFVIIDTVAQCNVGRDENDTGAMTEFTHALRAISRELGAHVAAVHHMGKSGQLRGNTSLPANLDTSITLKKAPGRVVTIECDRTKGAPFEAFSLVGRIVELPERDHYGHNITSLVFEQTDALITPNIAIGDRTREQVWGVLKLAPQGLRASDWQKEVEKTLGIKSSRFYDHRDALIEAGTVSQDGRIYPASEIYSDLLQLAPIRSKSEPQNTPIYSDDALASEQIGVMAENERRGVKKLAKSLRSRAASGTEPYQTETAPQGIFKTEEEGDEF